MDKLIANLRALGTKRLAALGAVFAGMLALMGIVANTGGSSGATALLYGDLDPKEASGMIELLKKNNIQYTLGDQGKNIYVDDAKVPEARLLLAKDGLPSSGSIGYEIFDRSSGITQTQFEQSINETRAIEGELERSIRLLNGIKSARVHVVMSRRQPFEATEEPAQASIMLSLNGAQRLSDESVSAVMNLVAAAVPGLKPDHIAIVDNHGDVLAHSSSRNGAMRDGIAAQQKNMEEDLSRSVESMLNAVVGYGHVKVQTSVRLDTDRVRETQERYDPDQQVLRSQQTTSEKSVNAQAPQNTTVSNNLPNANAAQSQASGQNTRQQETSNFEIGKTTREIVTDQPRVNRVSVAVIVDEVAKIDEKKNYVWAPRGKEELERLADLTKSAIGFDKTRGDVVTVVSMRFSDDESAHVEQPSKRPILSLASYKSSVWIKPSLFLLLVGSIGVFVLRPLTSSSRGSLSKFDIDLSPKANPEVAKSLLIPGPVRSSPGLIAPADDAMVHVEGVEGRIKASAIQRILDLVETHPEESVAMIRGWMAKGEGDAKHVR